MRCVSYCVLLPPHCVSAWPCNYEYLPPHCFTPLLCLTLILRSVLRASQVIPAAQVTTSSTPPSFFSLWASNKQHSLGTLGTFFIGSFFFFVFVLFPFCHYFTKKRLPTFMMPLLWGKRSLWLRKCRSLLFVWADASMKAITRRLHFCYRAGVLSGQQICCCLLPPGAWVFSWCISSCFARLFGYLPHL